MLKRTTLSGQDRTGQDRTGQDRTGQVIASNAMASSAFQSHISTNTIQTNSKLSLCQQCPGDQRIIGLSSTENQGIQECLYPERKCNGTMGVPITYLDKYNPYQFELIGVFNHGSDGEWDFAKCIVNGKEKFKRLAIRRKV